MFFRKVYDGSTGMPVQIPDTESDLRDFLAKGYRETPLQLPTVVAEPPIPPSPPPEVPPPSPAEEAKSSSDAIFVNKAPLKDLVSQMGISTAHARLLINNRTFENFDDLNELKAEGVDWTVWKDRFDFSS